MWHHVGSLESALAAWLARLAAALHGRPLSSACRALTPDPAAYAPLLDRVVATPHLAIPCAFVLAVLFVFATPSLITLFSSDPILPHVPLPSATYDPYDDPDVDHLADDDVRPQLCAPDAPRAIACYAPATGQLLGHVQAHAPCDVPPLVDAARLAQQRWQATSFRQRRAVLRVLRDYLIFNQKELCHLSHVDTGKPVLDACIGEILPTLEKIRWLLASGEAALRPDARHTGPLTAHKAAHVHFMPLGVIGAIAPWNYPLHNLLNPVLAALFAGNAVVVKPSEHTLFSSVHFARVARRALSACGHSPQLVQLAVGGADVGRAVADAAVDKLFFTGSTAVGVRVAQRAARRLLPLCLELGGKDALVVCRDADVAHAATVCLRGVFQNGGQNCIGVERVLLHQAVAGAFLQRVLRAVRRMRVGADVGALTMGEAAQAKIERLVHDAVRKGATLLAGGKRATVDGAGCFFEPTVLTDVGAHMDIANEEVFGPVMTVMTWSDEQQLVRMVNDCPFGLGASVFSADRSRAQAIVAKLRVGMCNVNDFAANYLCQSMPFGGTKQSGSDRFAGIEGLRGCCIPKAVTHDRWPGIKTRIPNAFRYPTGENAFELAAEINDFVYGRGVMCKIDNVRNLIGLLLFPSWRPRTVGSG